MSLAFVLPSVPLADAKSATPVVLECAAYPDKLVLLERLLGALWILLCCNDGA